MPDLSDRTMTLSPCVVFETNDAVNSEGNDIIKQLIRFASKRECMGTCRSRAAHGLEFRVVSKPLWLKLFSTGITLIPSNFALSYLCIEHWRFSVLYGFP